MGAARRRSKTDALGRYTLERLAPGRYEVQLIERVELRTGRPGRRLESRSRQATIHSDQVTVLDFAGGEGERATLIGIIRDEEAPVVKGEVRFFLASGARALRAPIVRGTFRIEDVPLGVHRLVIDPEMASSPRKAAGWGGTEFRVAIQSSGEIRREFRLPQGRIAGVVRGSKGKVGRAYVRLLRRQEDGFWDDAGGRRCDLQTGAFEFPLLASGDYRLIANALGSGTGRLEGAPRSHAISLAEGQVVENVMLDLREPGVVAFRVVDESGVGLSGVRVTLAGKEEATRSLGGNGRSGSGGEGAIRNLSPGRYGVLLRHEAYGVTAGRDVLVQAQQEQMVTFTVRRGHPVTLEVFGPRRQASPGRADHVHGPERHGRGALSRGPQGARGDAQLGRDLPARVAGRRDVPSDGGRRQGNVHAVPARGDGRNAAHRASSTVACGAGAALL